MSAAVAPRSSSSSSAQTLAGLALRWRTLQSEIAVLEAQRAQTDQPGWRAALGVDIDALTQEQYDIVEAAAAVPAPHPEGIAAKLTLLQAFVEAQAIALAELSGTPLDLFASLQRDLADLSRTPS